MAEPAIHRSKLDRWLTGVTVASTLFAVIACAPVLMVDCGAAQLVALATLLVVIGLPWWIMATTFYVVNDTEIRIRSGPFSWTVPTSAITSISRTRDPRSSPALSLDRLRIEYAGRAIMVSPEDPRRFLDDLARRGVEVATGVG